MTDKDLIEDLEAQCSLMIAVATGGPRIQDTDDEYKERRRRILSGLAERGIEDTNPHIDLWRWYGKWKKDLEGYQSRRKYIADLFDSLIERVRQGRIRLGSEIFDEPTGWERVDRGVESIKHNLETASTEEAYQAIGLLCREILISVAQAVFDSSLHVSVDGVQPSDTDAKRMLEAYFARELAGGPNEEARRHAKAALDLANSLQHRRTASFRDAALCAEATTAVVNIIAIISGRRNPRTNPRLPASAA